MGKVTVYPFRFCGARVVHLVRDDEPMSGGWTTALCGYRDQINLDGTMTGRICKRCEKVAARTP
jgi:hypothetical protein